MIGKCSGCGKEKEILGKMDFFIGAGDEAALQDVCHDCRREYEELVSEINAETLALAKKQNILKDT